MHQMEVASKPLARQVEEQPAAPMAVKRRASWIRQLLGQRLRRVTASDPLPISVQRPVTKYEGKAQHAGSAVAELLWEKRP